MLTLDKNLQFIIRNELLNAQKILKILVELVNEYKYRGNIISSFCT